MLPCSALTPHTGKSRTQSFRFCLYRLKHVILLQRPGLRRLTDEPVSSADHKRGTAWDAAEEMAALPRDEQCSCQC